MVSPRTRRVAECQLPEASFSDDIKQQDGVDGAAKYSLDDYEPLNVLLIDVGPSIIYASTTGEGETRKIVFTCSLLM